MLTIAIFLKQLVWIALVPIWQTPDEQAHFAQVQNIAESNKIGKFSSSKEIEVAEKLLGVKRDLQNNNFFTYHPEYKIQYTSSLIGKYEKTINNQPTKNRKNLVFKEATGYPPLYYQLSAIAYKLVNHEGLIDRVFAVRIFQSIFVLLLIFIFGKMAALLMEKKYVNYFLIFILFLPMPSFVSTGVTSDNLMNLLFPMTIYLCLLLLKNKIEVKYFVFFIFIYIFGQMTKPHFIISVPIFLAALFLKIILMKKYKLLLLPIVISPLLMIIVNYKRFLIFLQTGAVSSLFPDIGIVPAEKAFSPVNIFSYLKLTLSKTYRETIPWFWGVFRWLSFTLDRWYYRIMNLLTVIASLTGIVFFLQKKNWKKNNYFDLFFLVLSVFIYFAILFFWDYLFFLGHNFSFGIQGRYYFPILFSIICLMFIFLRKIIPAGLLAFFSIAANIYALYKLSASYFDFSSFSAFIIQASQYKPWFFKGNWLILLIFTFFSSLVALLLKLSLDKNKQND